MTLEQKKMHNKQCQAVIDACNKKLKKEKNPDEIIRLCDKINMFQKLLKY